jgi:Tol biopolymer transport system component
VKAVIAIALALALASVSSSAGSTPRANGRIVFVSNRVVQNYRTHEIYSLDLATGRSRPLTNTTAEETEPTLSPNGRSIAYVRRSLVRGAPGELWVMRSNGRSQRRLAGLDLFSGATAGPQPITWAPDGSRIAFSVVGPAESIGLWVVGADGSGLRRLTDFPVKGPRWSPDGPVIAFHADVDFDYSRVGFVAPDGTGLHWLTTSAGVSDKDPAWSPSGRQLAFIHSTGARSCAPYCGTTNVVVADADGAHAHALTAYNNSGLLNDPAWSPNGRRLAFLNGRGDISVIGSDGTGLRKIANGARPVSWSPRGDRLAFGKLLYDHTGLSRPSLTVKGLQGPAHHFLLSSRWSLLDSGPAWSRDGRSLIYSAVVDKSDLELFSVTPEGNGLRRLTHDRLDDFDPAWSPEGRRIAFARGAFELNPDSNVPYGLTRSSLYVMDASGNHLRRLTKGGVDAGPSWAPDGRRIAFVRSTNYGQVVRLKLLDLRTGRLRSLGPLTDVAPLADSVPAWSPDGRLIAFAQNATVQTVRPDGRGRRTLFRAPDDGGVPGLISRPSWSPDGQQLVFNVLYDHGRFTTGGNVIVSRTGQAEGTFACLPSSPPPFELEYPELLPTDRLAWSPDGQSIAENGIAACRVDGSSGAWVSQGFDPDWQARPAA